MRIVLTLLSLFWAFLLFMTGARFLILLFDLNRESEIVNWVLSKSEFWVKPFFDILGLANRAVEETGGVFEPASLIAFVVYFVIGGVILGVIRNATGSGGYGLGHWRHA